MQRGKVGCARAFGVRQLLDTCPTPASQLWLANTDADSQVPANWFTGMLSYAEAGHTSSWARCARRRPRASRHRAWLGRHQLPGAAWSRRAPCCSAVGGASTARPRR